MSELYVPFIKARAHSLLIICPPADADNDECVSECEATANISLPSFRDQIIE